MYRQKQEQEFRERANRDDSDPLWASAAVDEKSESVHNRSVLNARGNNNVSSRRLLVTYV